MKREDDELQESLQYILGPYTISRLSQKTDDEILKIILNKKDTIISSYKRVKESDIKLGLENKKRYVKMFREINKLVEYYGRETIQETQ